MPDTAWNMKAMKEFIHKHKEERKMIKAENGQVEVSGRKKKSREIL